MRTNLRFNLVIFNVIFVNIYILAASKYLVYIVYLTTLIYTAFSFKLMEYENKLYRFEGKLTGTDKHLKGNFVSFDL